jgi:AraC-like DNA-binding protein
VAVSARSVKNFARPARHGLVDLRGPGRTLAGSYVYEGERVATGWHHHDMHQLEYALLGVVEVETAQARYLLPPQQAAWIPAGLEHETTIDTAVRTISVFFDPGMIGDGGERARILAIDPLLRAMMVRSVRWPIDRPDADAVADRYFCTLADLVVEALDDEAPLSLPTSRHPVVAAAMAYTQAHLATATVGRVSAAVNVSERTLRRLFDGEVQLSWRSYLQHARVLRAMALLAGGDATVLEIATTVGFDSVTAFSRAFLQRCGETPSEYRQRVRAT